MKRRKDLFEFVDYNLRPFILRDGMTKIMRLLHRLLKSEKIFASKISRVVRITGIKELLDLCSGAGGPFPELVYELQKTYDISIRASLSDLFPDKTASGEIKKRCSGINYIARSVDACDIPRETASIRTIFLGFHHMPERAAKSILRDAYEKERPLCIFEISEHSWKGILTALFVPFVIFVFTPFIKPSLSQLFFTYIIPIIPLMMTWDGIVSQLRTYSVQELRELTRDLKKPGYHWDIGIIDLRYLPHKPPYLMGIPVKDNRHANPGGTPDN